MRPAFIKQYWKFKRFLFKKLVPEIIWPRYVSLDGVQFQVRNTPYSTGTKYILSTGKYEWAERKLLATFIKPGDRIVEMGGSIGVLTAIMANRIGPSGRLVSIEAAKNLVSYSAPWLEKNTNTRVIAGFAFPVYSCKAEIRVTSFDESAGALAGVVSFDWLPAENPVGAMHVHRETIFDLKTIASQFGIEPNILVVDIEGSERIILEDASVFNDSIKIILIELHPAHYGIQTEKAIVSKITRLGYIIAAVVENTYLFSKTDEPRL